MSFSDFNAMETEIATERSHARGPLIDPSHGPENSCVEGPNWIVTSASSALAAECQAAIAGKATTGSPNG